VISLVTLTLLEVVLGIDNVVFLSILVGRLPPAEQPAIRRIGLGLALIARLGLLGAISWIVRLTAPWFTVLGHAFSGRDLILLGGGLFLLFKSTQEIYEKLEVPHHEHDTGGRRASTGAVLFQIMLLDIVFSLDSVITAVGLARQFWIMATAMVMAVGVMMIFAGAISDFVNRHPSMKILALSFLLLIGVLLVAEGTGQHIDRGYVYFAMAFSLGVELLNLRLRRAQQPVVLHHRFEDERSIPAPAGPPGQG
jgi:predicted tellurium resistance membrane protein TerC